MGNSLKGIPVEGFAKKKSWGSSGGNCTLKEWR